MSKVLDNNIAEIESFLTKFRTSPPKLEGLFKTQYKQFHSLLIWGFCYETDINVSETEKLFFKETLSDLSHSLFLLLLNLYKPSRFSIRSSIENFVRAILISRKIDVGSISTVHGLFDEANLVFKNHEEIKNRIGELRGIYSELCKSAHSVKIDYLSLTIPLNQITDFDQKAYTDISKVFLSVCRLINQITFLIHHDIISLAGHRNSDALNDSIPNALKRKIAI